MNDDTLIVFGIVLVMIVFALAWDWHETRRERWNEHKESEE